MTIRECHILIRQLLDAEAALAFVRLDKTQIDVFLDYAQRRFITERFTGTSPVKPGVGFEQDQKRFQDLRTVVIDDFVLVVDNGIAPLPTDFWYSAGVEAEVTNTRFGKKDRYGVIDQRRKLRYPVSEVTHNQSTDVRIDPFSRPNRNFNFYISYNQSGAELFGTAEAFYLSYIKKPTKPNYVIGQDLVIPDHAHIEVCEMAVRRMLEIYDPNRAGVLDLQKIE